MDKKTGFMLIVIAVLLIACIFLGTIIGKARRSTDEAFGNLQSARSRVTDLEASISERDKTISDLREAEDRRSEYYSILDESVRERQRIFDEIGRIAEERQGSFNRIGDLIERGRAVLEGRSVEDAE